MASLTYGSRVLMQRKSQKHFLPKSIIPTTEAYWIITLSSGYPYIFILTSYVKLLKDLLSIYIDVSSNGSCIIRSFPI